MNSPFNILLIDDDHDTHNIFRMYTDHHNHALLVAEDGAQGLSILENESPDMIFVDIVLPDIDGYRILEQIRQNNLAPDSTVVAISAYHTSDTMQTLLEHGFEGFFPKPIALSDVIKTVEKLQRGK